MSPVNKPHFLLIGGWQEIVEKLAWLDVRITLLHSDAFAEDCPVAQLCERVIQVDTEDPQACLERVRALSMVQPFNAVYAIREHDLMTAAVIGEELGIHCNPAQAVRLSRDKAAMRARLAGTELETLRWTAPASLSEARAMLDQIGLPAILKPATGFGSQHVFLVRDESALADAWSVQPEPWVLEQFVGGREYSVEFVSLDGRHYPLGITEKEISGPPHFYETGHLFPAELDADVERRVYRAVTALLDRIGHRFGMSHTEIKLDGGHLHILETHTRPGGDRIWKLAELATGVDAISLSFRSLLGEELHPQEMQGSRAAAVGFFHGAGGTVRHIGGMETARAMPGVFLVSLTMQEGLMLASTCSSDTRYGFVVTHGESRAEARHRLNRAMAAIEIDMDMAFAGDRS